MEPVQPEASVVQSGKGIRYIGDHAYAYSGSVTDTDSGSPETTVLDFISGSGYIDARVSILSDESGAAALYTQIELNDVPVFILYGDASAVGSFQFDNPFYMLIPPFTRFHLKVGANATVVFTAMITGRVYGAK